MNAPGDGSQATTPSVRVRKPAPERTSPVRQYSEAARSRTDGPPSPASADVEELIARGVSSAYDVIDEYVRAGRRVASQLATASFGPLPSDDDASRLTARVIEGAEEAAAAWVELIGLVVGSGSSRPPSGVHGDGSGSAGATDLAALEEAAARAAGTPVPLFAIPAARGRASFAVIPLADTGEPTSLRTTAFTTVGRDDPALPPATVTTHDGTVTLGITVAAAQATGVYLGLVQSADRPLAAVAVHVA